VYQTVGKMLKILIDVIFSGQICIAGIKIQSDCR
jgi:hypothetical protein